MPEPTFRDRFLATSVNRTVLSPLGIALGLVLAAVAVAVGVPVVAAALLGVVVWAARALLAVPRPTRPERIDPFTVQDPWRRFVQDAVTVRNRFDEAVHGMAPGPLQDNLRDVATRVHTAVAEAYRVAQRGQALDQARRRIDVPGIERQRRRLATADAADASGPSDAADPVVEQVARSLDAQEAAAARLDQVVADAQARLRLLDARMDEALARALEVSAHSGSTEALGGGAALPGASGAPGALGSLGTDVEDVVTDLEALRQALEETHGTPGGLAAPGGAP
jgi:hypothetical protein